MSVNTEDWWEALENRRQSAFVVAGVLFLVDTVFMWADLVAGISISGAVFVVLFVSALIVTLFGTLGFYPSVADRAPRLALISTAPIALAGISLPIVFLWAIIASLLNQPLPPGAIALFIIILIFLGFLLFGVSSVRADAPSRITGVLILVLVGTWITWFAGLGIWGAHHLPKVWSPAFSGVTAIVTLALGYVLYGSPVME